jgi:hypothetical protein
MICYNHKDKQAIAICKNCFKAICEQCAIPDDNGFACSEKCHQEIISYNAMMEKSKAVYGLKPGRIPVNTLLPIVLGVPFIILGGISLIGREYIGCFPLSAGLIFIAFGIASYINMKKSGIRS